MYQHDMSEERPPKRLLSEGWKKFCIMNVKDKNEDGSDVVSKSGNTMILVTIEEETTKHQETLYLVSEPKKRWSLKNLLDAVGIKPDKDLENKYVWEPANLVGVEIQGLVVHEPNEYINRSGNTVKETQHRIVEFRHIETEGWIE